MLRIKFNRNRKKINIISILFCKVYSCILKKMNKHYRFTVVNTERLAEIVAIHLFEGDTFREKDANQYICLKNRKNYILKMLQHNTANKYIIKIYSYKQSWFTEGILLKLIMRKSIYKDMVPTAIYSGVLKLDDNRYRKQLLFNMFHYFESVNFKEANTIIDKRKELYFMYEIGRAYKKLEEELNRSLLSKLIVFFSRYRFGDNMYNLHSIDKHELKQLRRQTKALLKKYKFPYKQLIQNDLYELNIMVDYRKHVINKFIDFEFLSLGNVLVNMYYAMYDFYEDGHKMDKQCLLAFCKGYGISIKFFVECETILKKWNNIFRESIKQEKTNDDIEYFFLRK